MPRGADDRIVCGICRQPIGRGQKIVRVVTELVSRGEGDGEDPSMWSNVEDWAYHTVQHLTCARDKLEANEKIPYGEEIEHLALVDAEPEQSLPFRIVKGGA